MKWDTMGTSGSTSQKRALRRQLAHKFAVTPLGWGCWLGKTELCLKSSVRRPVSRVLSCPLRGMDGHSSGARITAGFARPTRAEGRKCPRASAFRRRAVRPYSALLRVGFTLPPPLLGARCALTAPFHPYREVSPRRGGLFSVALSLRSPPPAINRHPIPVEPGLSSSP